MLLADPTQKYVANKLGKDIRTVRRWLARYNSSKDLQHRKGDERHKKLKGGPRSSLQNLLEKDTSQRDVLLNKLQECVLLSQKTPFIAI